MQRSLGFWVNLAIAVTFLVVGVFGVVSYRNTSGLVEISERVTRIHKTLQELESLLSILIDSETGQRGYILTGDERYLEPYNAAMNDLDGTVKNLRDQFAPNKEQRERF